jgi:beta-N-acetylhexosaminidase
LSGPDGSPPRAVIFGCAGIDLADQEWRFFADSRPLGLILFERNCETPDQVRALVRSFRHAVGREDAPVLIDQEGGRVVRLKPPHWRAAPAARIFARLHERDPAAGCDAARLNARLVAGELADLGITVDCAPVLDLAVPDGHDIIGDRALGATAQRVAELGAAVCHGLLAGGVLPVIKHLPGHGRAGADSHLELPVVETPRTELAATDFRAFQALNRMPWGMTAHVLYRALDEAAPATVSAPVVGEVIRGEIGFDGLLLTDDLGMRALAGSLAERTRAGLEAGCDVALHCSGEMAEMVQVAGAAPALSEAAMARIARGEAVRQETMHAPCEDGEPRLQSLLAPLEEV